MMMLIKGYWIYQLDIDNVSHMVHRHHNCNSVFVDETEVKLMSVLNREIVVMWIDVSDSNAGIFKGTCEMVYVILTTVHIIL